MKTDMIIQDYYGASYFLEANADRHLVVFLVDDNKFYLNLLKNLIKMKNVTVHSFTSGEESLDCLALKPDLVILDYHLDGTNPKAQKGDVIAHKIHEKLPSTEIILISSDQKFKLLMDLKSSIAKNIIFKDRQAPSVLKSKVTGLSAKKSDWLQFRKSVIILVIIILGVISIIVLLGIIFI